MFLYAPKCSETEKETYQTYTFSGRVRIEEANHNIMFFVIRHASDLDIELTVTFFSIPYFLLESEMLEYSNNKAFRLNDKVIDNLSSFQETYRFSGVQQIVTTLDPFFSYAPGYYNFSHL